MKNVHQHVKQYLSIRAGCAGSTPVLGIFECNKIDLLKDVFIWAYERSAEKYMEKFREVALVAA